MSNVIIRVETLTKEYRLGVINHGTLRQDLQSWWARSCGKEDPNSLILKGANSAKSSDSPHMLALNNVSFDVQEGEILGIIGRNGAGKSTLLKILSRVTAPTKGSVKIRGRVASLLEVGTGFHPDLTGRENIYLNGAILGMTKKEIRLKFDEIVDFAEIEKFVDTPVKRYSSGMYVRLAFAVAAHLEPEILIVDEVLAVGDAGFQKKCLGKMGDVAKAGRTVLFVSHNMAAVKNLCSKAILLQNGVKCFEGDTFSAINKYFMRDENDAAIVRWDSSSAPSVTSAHLIEVEILSDANRVGTELSTEEPIQVYIKFRVTRENKIGTTVLLSNSEGQCLFSSLSNHEPKWHGKNRPKGVYVSVCEVPSNFLAAGRYSVGVVLWEGVYEASVVERDVLQFMAYDKGLVRGDLTYDIKNVLTF